MVIKRNLAWLDKKLARARFFDGSLLSYVSPSPDVVQLRARLGGDSANVLKLDANENFFVDPHFLNELFALVLKDIDLRFYDSKSIADLKKALGKYVSVPTECVIVGSGSEQLLDFFTRFFLEKGDEAISVVPSFFMYEKRVRLSGATLITVPIKADLALDVDAVLKKITEKTKLILLCSPNNPAGNQFSLGDIESLADQSSAVVVVDEAYVEFGDYSVCPSAVCKKNVVVLRTFSKAFGLAGLRFGYAVANEDLSSVFSEIIPYTVSTVTARYVQKLLDNAEVVQKWIELLKEERTRLLKELYAVSGIDVWDSKTNFVTFKPHRTAALVYAKLLERGIIIKDLGDLPVIGHCLRATVGLPNMNEQFLSALSEIMIKTG